MVKVDLSLSFGPLLSAALIIIFVGSRNLCWLSRGVSVGSALRVVSVVRVVRWYKQLGFVFCCSQHFQVLDTWEANNWVIERAVVEGENRAFGREEDGWS